MVNKFATLKHMTSRAAGPSTPKPQAISQMASRLLSRIPAFWARVIIVGWDAAAWAVALLILVVLRYDMEFSSSQWTWVLIYSGFAITLQVALGLMSQLYLGRSRIGSFSEVSLLSGVVLMAGVPLGLVLSFATPNFPRGVALVLPPLALVCMAAGRWAFRTMFSDRESRRDRADAVPILVYGAGEAGHQVAALVDHAEIPPYRIVGFVDDDPAKRFRRIRGYRVWGTGKDLIWLANKHGAEKIVLAISHATPQLLKSVSDQSEQHGLNLAVLPHLREMIGGKVSLEGLRQFSVGDLLGRRPIRTDLSTISDHINGKVVLVTGAGGSIGSELAVQLHSLGPRKLLLLDRDESALHGAQLAIYGVGLLDTEDVILCDIRDQAALQEIFDYHRPEVVFHAAALKHLPMLERFPDEAWKTNVLGSLNVLQCAYEVGARSFVNVSTDKAASPTSNLGRTKRLAERLTAWYAQEYGIPYLSVRFGNVLGSRGSVLHAFRAQIDRGGPVTVTHPDVTRYFMTIQEACELVIQAGAIGSPGDILVLDMGEPIKIIDVAKRLLAESDKHIEIEFSGLRDGEKVHEVLFSDSEQQTASSHPLISRVHASALDPESVSAKRPRLEVLNQLLAAPNCDDENSLLATEAQMRIQR